MDENQEYDPAEMAAEIRATSNRLIAEIKALGAEVKAADRANREGHEAAVEAAVRAATRRQIPKTVSRGQLVKACTAFCDALGFSPTGAGFPLFVTESAVSFPAYPVAAGDGPRPPKRLPSKYGLASPQREHSAAVLTTMVTIEVAE